MDSPIKWAGGKSLLSREIVKLIPEHMCYVEVFGGAAWVLFRKRPSSVEVYNDIDDRLFNFWKILQSQTKLKAFLRMGKNDFASRKIFEFYKNTKPKNNIERAYRFYYLLMNSFSGNCNDLGVKSTRQSSFSGFFKEKWIKIHDRMKCTMIESLDYRELINRYDGEDTFFYCDPPYYGLKLYDFSFDVSDHKNLKNCLSKIKGKFLLSYKDCNEIRELWKDYEITEHKQIYSFSRSSRKENIELLISNYPQLNYNKYSKGNKHTDWGKYFES